MTLPRDLPVITGGTITLTNGSRVVNGAGVGSLWRSTRTNAGVTETEDAVGRGYWLVPVDGSAVPLAAPVMVLRLVTATQLELVAPWPGTTLTGTAYQIVSPGTISQAIASEILRQAAGRGGPSSPFVSALFQNGARRAGLFLNADGSVDLGTGPSATDYPSLTMRRLINPDGSAAFASLAGATFGSTLRVTGTVVAGALYGASSNGSERWVWGRDGLAEAGANAGSNWALYRYSDAGAYLGAPIYVIRGTGVVQFEQNPVVLGSAIWHAANFGRPQTAPGIGQIVAVNAADNTAVNAPAGGTWMWLAFFGTAFDNRMHRGVFTGTVAGGAVALAAPGVGASWSVFFWRIA